MPTGTGKSVVIGEFVRRAYTKFPGTRILMLTHVKELIQQNFEKLLQLWPSAPAGIFSAGLGRKDTCFPITFGGIASAVRGNFGHIDLVIVDEAHKLSPNEDTQYQRMVQSLRSTNPLVKVVGLTATPFRLGQGLLTDEEGLFTDVCFDMTGIEPFNWLISEGYLVPLIPKKTGFELNVDEVRIHGGEFVQKDLQEAVDKESVSYSALREAINLAHDRNHWLVFASGVEHALHVCDMLDSLGVSACCVHSKMSTEDRDAVIADFRAGRYRAMVNNNILTTGFDFPGIDCIVMLRPTQSASLWVQMLGRGTRPVFPGARPETKEERLAAIASSSKQNCLVLDFAGNTRRLGPINDPVMPKRKGKGGTGQAPVKVCEVCNSYNHASVRFCTVCGAEFAKVIKIDAAASTDKLIADSAMRVEAFRVDRVVYQLFKKTDRPDSVRVSYYCGLRLFHEWLCFEHVGYAHKKARDLWRERSKTGMEPPATTAQALARINELRVPNEIKVWVNKPHPDIVGYSYADRPQPDLPSGLQAQVAQRG